MQLEGIEHQPLSKDAYAKNESNLVIRIRTVREDMSQCILYYGDRVCVKDPIRLQVVDMEKIGSDELFDYYESSFRSPYTRVCYFFRLVDQLGDIIYFSEYGFTKKPLLNRTQFFQFPYIRREDIIRIPEWTKNMIMYHIFPDSFASGKDTIEEKRKEIKVNDTLLSKSKNGGTIRGIIDNIDYLKNLGVNCIYLNPIFTASSYHKYDTIDYFHVDPCFGNNEDFKELVEKLHEEDMYIILDGVFNHCGSGFFAFQDVLKNQEKSKYKDWFYELTFPLQYKTPPNYEAFAYVKEMPKLNTGNKEVVDYFCSVGKYWISEYGIDGWRLDVANEVNHNFWRTFRQEMHRVKEEVFLIGEIWEDSTVWLTGDQFDSTMNYTFANLCRDFFALQTISVSKFDQRICRMNLRYPEMTAYMQMNFLDTHDVPRFYTYCQGNLSMYKLAILYMMTGVGIPSIFYGDEKGIVGETEDAYRSPMPWDSECNQDLLQYTLRLIHIRRKYKALAEGRYLSVIIDDKNRIYGFLRTTEREKILVLLNLNDETQNINMKEVLSETWFDLLNEEHGEGSIVTCKKQSGRVIMFC